MEFLCSRPYAGTWTNQTYWAEAGVGHLPMMWQAMCHLLGKSNWDENAMWPAESRGQGPSRWSCWQELSQIRTGAVGSPSVALIATVRFYRCDCHWSSVRSLWWPWRNRRDGHRASRMHMHQPGCQGGLGTYADVGKRRGRGTIAQNAQAALLAIRTTQVHVWPL